MRSELAGRLRARGKRRAVWALTRLLQRTAGRAPVIVPEYDLDPRPRWGWTSPPPAALTAFLADQEQAYEPAIDAMLELTGWAATVARDPIPGSPVPSWENSYWGGVDAVALVSELRRRNPGTYMEVGSGYTTRFARAAIGDFALGTEIVSIDPEPRADVDALCDTVLRSSAADVDMSVFRSLKAGDVLLIDGSHMAFMNSDAAVLLLEVLPELAAGVLVAVHDVYLPWDYPPAWEPRMYSEQYVLAALLLGGGGGWSVRFPAWYVTRVSPLGERLNPLWEIVGSRVGRLATSFWMERNA